MQSNDGVVQLALRGFLVQLGIKSAGYQPIIRLSSGQRVVLKINGKPVAYTAPTGGNYYVSEISNSISRLGPSDGDVD